MKKLKTTLGILMISSAVTVSAMGQHANNDIFTIPNGFVDIENRQIDPQVQEFLIVLDEISANLTAAPPINVPQAENGGLQLNQAQANHSQASVSYREVAAMPEVQELYYQALPAEIRQSHLGKNYYTGKEAQRVCYSIGLCKYVPKLQEAMNQMFEHENQNPELQKRINGMFNSLIQAIINHKFVKIGGSIGAEERKKLEYQQSLRKRLSESAKRSQLKQTDPFAALELSLETLKEIFQYSTFTNADNKSISISVYTHHILEQMKKLKATHPIKFSVIQRKYHDVLERLYLHHQSSILYNAHPTKKPLVALYTRAMNGFLSLEDFT